MNDRDSLRTMLRLLPAIAMTVMLVFFNGVAMIVAEWVRDEFDWQWGSWILTLTVGSMFGQGCLVALLGGLVGRSWLIGFLLGIGLTTTSFFFNVFCLVTVLDEKFDEAHVIATLLPLLILAAITPMLGCRQFLGWRLTTDTVPTRPREPNGIEDMLGATAVVATSMMLARVPEIYWEQNATEYWTGMGIGICVIVVTSAFAVLPATYLAFRVHNAMWSWLGLIGIALLSPPATYLFLIIISSIERGGMPTDIISDILWACVTAATTSFFAIVILKLSGVRLQVFDGQTRDSPDTVDGEETPPATKRFRFQHRLMTAGFVCVAIVAGICTGMITGRREKIDGAHVMLREHLEQQGGGLIVDDRKIKELHLGSEGANDMLMSLADVGDMDKLSLANSRVTDAGLEDLAALPHFNYLDLSGTRITDAGLRHIRKLPIRGLSIANTQVSMEGIRSLAVMTRLETLDIGNLGLTDDDIEELNMRKYMTLSLRGNKLTNAGIANIVQRVQTSQINPLQRSLDLSDMPVDGSTLTLRQLEDLKLDGTNFSDAQLNRGTTVIVGTLSLQNTKMTDSGLRLVNKAFQVQKELAVGGPLLTDAGLPKLGQGWISTLRLHCPNMTGKCFKNWVPSCQHLDLSRSGITDENIVHIVQQLNLQILNLDRTKITDEGLQELTSIKFLQQLSIKQTKVTARGLTSVGLPSHVIIHVEHGQFSDEELARLRSAMEVRVDAAFPVSR